MKKYLFALLLYIGCFQLASAQMELDLSKCIEIAKSKNLSLKQGELNLANGAIQLDQSLSNRLPSLNGSAGHNYNFGRSIDPFTNQYINQSIQSNSFSINSSAILFNGFQLQNTIKMNKQNLKVTQKDLEVINNNISLSVSTLYLQIVLNEEQLKNSLQQKSLTEAQLNRARLMLEAGTVSKSSVVNLEAQLASDEMNIVTARNTIRNNYAQLSALLQMENYTDFKIKSPEIQIPKQSIELPLQDIINLALDKMPEIERDKMRIESSSIGLEIAKGAYYPKLVIFGNLNTVYSQSRKERYDITNAYIPIGFVEGTNQPVLSQISNYKLRTTTFGKQLSDNFGQGVGLSLSIPIYNNHRITNNVSASKIAIEQSQLTLANTTQQLKNDIITSYANYENAQSRYNASVKNEEAQKLNFEYTQDRFDAGLLNSLELLNAKNLWAAAQNNLSQAKYEYIFRKLILDFYQGIPLSIN